jgi:tryptophan-rich sensory protein
MPASQLVFFLIWLLAALAAGAALYAVWQRLYEQHGR